MAYYRESLADWLELKDRWNAAPTLEGVAVLAAESGRCEAAARLLGASAAMRDAAGAPVPANDRADYDRLLDRVRAALPGAAFAAIWAAGRALSLEEAIAEALALVDGEVASRVRA